jgi:hypothetical protein
LNHHGFFADLQMKDSMKPNFNRRLLLLMALILAAACAPAQELKASLIIVGPGDPLYTYWGHIGIAVEDTRTGESLFYDFGNFSFFSENFYQDFAMGRMMYLGFVDHTERFLSYTLRENRDVSIYPLNLGEAELAELDQVLKWWVQPENREYLYDYFRNNCSTIIRDILDNLTGGQLKKFSEVRPDRTFRHYARTGSDPSFFSEVLLHYLLGADLDLQISGWDKMFIPQSVADFGSELTYTGRDGVSRQLVDREIVLVKSDRRPVPEKPRLLWPAMLIMGIATGLLWLFAGMAAVRPGVPRGLRSAGLIFRLLISLLIGIAGLMLGFLMVFTDHTAAYRNLNLGPAFPAVLAGLILLFPPRRKTAEARKRREKLLSWLWTLNLAGLLLAVLLRLSGLSIQDSFSFWAFFGPLNLAASRAGLWLADRWQDRLSGGRPVRP